MCPCLRFLTVLSAYKTQAYTTFLLLLTIYSHFDRVRLNAVPQFIRLCLLLIFCNSVSREETGICGLRQWPLYLLCRCGKLLTIGLLALKSWVLGQTLPNLAMPVIRADFFFPAGQQSIVYWAIVQSSPKGRGPDRVPFPSRRAVFRWVSQLPCFLAQPQLFLEIQDLYVATGRHLYNEIAHFCLESGMVDNGPTVAVRNPQWCP